MTSTDITAAAPEDTRRGRRSRERHRRKDDGRLGLLPGDDANRRVRAVLAYLDGVRG